MWIEIFRGGEQTNSNGVTKTFTETELNNIVEVYNRKVAKNKTFEAPLVLGHPKTDEPAFGWVKKIEKRGEKIFAQVKQVNKEVKELVQKALYKKVSISLYPDMMLKHVGLLGATSPAVKGLENVKFNENNSDEKISEVNSKVSDNEFFKEKRILEDKVTSLQEQVKKMKMNDELNKLKVEVFKKLGFSYQFETSDLASEFEDRIEKLYLSYEGKNELEFSENLKNFSLMIVDFSKEQKGSMIDEFTDNSNFNEELTESFSQKFSQVFEKNKTENEQIYLNAEPEKLALHNKILDLSRAKNMSYEDAFLLVE